MDYEGRLTSSFDLSIGTGLAFESLLPPTHPRYDESREIPNKVNLNEYTRVFVNVITLARNIIASFNTTGLVYLGPTEVGNILNYEINVITELLKSQNPAIDIHYYLSEYEHVGSNVDQVKLRVAKTEKQKLIETLKSMGISRAHASNPDIVLYKNVIDVGYTGNVIMFTSSAVDLATYKGTGKLSMLESNTGMLKPRHLWYTKYYNGADLNMLPLTHKLLKIFGDNIHYSPMSIKVKEQIIDLAKDKKWTPLTTQARVSEDINNYLKDRYLADIYKLL